MRIKWLESVDELRLHSWDLLTEDGDLFMYSGWLDITESSDPDLMEPPKYLMVLDDNGPIIGNPIYILPADAIPDTTVRVDLMQREALQRIDPQRDWGRDLMPCLLCGGWVPFNSRLLSRPNPAPEAISMTLDALTGYGEERGVSSLVFMYVDHEERDLRAALAQRGFAGFEAMPRTVMEIAWPDFEGYIRALPKKTRQVVRSEERKLAAAGVTYEIAEFTAADIAPFASLVSATASKHEPESSEHELARWLATMQEQTYVPTRVIKARLNGQLCAYLLLVEWQGVLYPQHGGFDYELKGKLPIYFGLVFYQTIRYALSRGVRRIEYSLGSGRAKQSRGCKLRRQWTMVRAFDGSVQDMLIQAQAQDDDTRAID